MRLKTSKAESGISPPLNLVVADRERITRPATPADDATLIAIARSTGVFSAAEIDCLREDLEAYHDGLYGVGPDGDLILVTEQDGQVAGFAHYGKLVITERTWMLHWIAVDRREQCRGVGRELMAQLENSISLSNGRLILIETASNPSYVPTRSFYLRQGYTLAALIEDYYSDGDHKCVFSKRLEQVKSH